ncbi:MAG: hypothetical protein EOO14_09335 [Chitinophagaceae bacterium]|nr:MAG: hypothetical protein EOO14_09335 [Chitinophagaceae bacterium]
MAGNLKIPKYVFRGTTIGYEGGNTQRKYKYTPTSKHIVKAALFAADCANKYPTQSVVYICETATLTSFGKPSGNRLKKYEEELAWPVVPEQFYPNCIGFVYLKDLLMILTRFGIVVEPLVDKTNITELCKKVKKIPEPTIEEIVDALSAYLQ